MNRTCLKLIICGSTFTCTCLKAVFWSSCVFWWIDDRMEGRIIVRNRQRQFQGGWRRFLAFPSHPLLLQYLNAKQTAWLHLQRVIFCLCHINRQHNAPPPLPQPSQSGTSLFLLVCKTWWQQLGWSEDFFFLDMYKMQMCVLVERLTHTNTYTSAHRHKTQPEQLVCGRKVSPTAQRTQMWGEAKANTLYTSKAFLRVSLDSQNKHMSNHIP